MTLEQSVGQLLWCGWGNPPELDARAVNDHARYLVEELQVGGLILFPRNLGEPVEIAALTAELRRRSALPPLIGIDQEGGRVCRLPLPGLTFPGNMALGALDDVERTRAVTRALGEQLGALGIDVDFAPVVDVNNNPANPIIGVRSFGEEPERVARHGVAAVAGFRDAGLLPVLKHFPGHGDTSADSHLELPRQPAGRTRLDAVELVPFRAALAADAPAVMTTHIVFRELDPEWPATLSPPILTGLLRNELGFDGLVVTDCLEMEGITDHWGPEEAAIRALEAGADMLLVCHTQEVQARMHAAVCAAVRAGRLRMERVDEAVGRVRRARELTAAVAQRPPQPDRVGAAEHVELERRTTEEALTLAPGSPLIVFRAEEPLTVAGATEFVAPLAEALSGTGLNAAAVDWTEDSLAALASASQILWIAAPQAPFAGGRPSEALYRLLATHPRAAVAAVGEPYLLAHYPPEIPRLAAWGGRPLHLCAVARWAAGLVEARGRLPVRLEL